MRLKIYYYNGYPFSKNRNSNAVLHIIHAHTHGRTPSLYSQEWSTKVSDKNLSKQKSLELVLNSENVGIFLKLAVSEFQTDGTVKLKQRSPKDFKLGLRILSSC